MKVFKKADTFSHSGSLEGWIRRIVYVTLCDHYRRNSKSVHFILVDELKDQDQDQSSSALDQLYYEDLVALLDHIAPRSKEVFQLYAIDGYTHKDISSTLGISVGTSKWHLAKARQQLQSLLSQKIRNNYAG